MAIAFLILFSLFICSCSNSEQETVKPISGDEVVSDLLNVDTLATDSLKDRLTMNDSIPVDTLQGNENSVVENTLQDMWLAKASGAVVTLGTNEKVRSIDRPKMQVNLTYDFYVGRHEVT